MRKGVTIVFKQEYAREIEQFEITVKKGGLRRWLVNLLLKNQDFYVECPLEGKHETAYTWYPGIL